jgi:hypothetical protein
MRGLEVTICGICDVTTKANGVVLLTYDYKLGTRVLRSHSLRKSIIKVVLTYK